MKSALRSWKFWLGMALSALCVWLALRPMKISELGEHLAGMRTGWLAPTLAALLVSIVLRSARWIVLLRARGHLMDAFWSQGIGYLFTNILPLRMGEAARVMAMAQRTRKPILAVAASAVIERLLDVGTVVVLLIVLLPFLDLSPQLRRSGVVFSILCAGGIAGLLVSVGLEKQFERLLRFLLGWIGAGLREKLIERWRELIAGIRPLLSPGVAAGAVGLSLALWACSVCSNYFILKAFQPQAAPVEAAFLLVATCFAVSVPSSPGFIGIFHYVAQQTLVLQFGAKYDLPTALSIALTCHLVYFVGTNILGLIGIWRLGGSLAQWRRTAENVSGPTM